MLVIAAVIFILAAAAMRSRERAERASGIKKLKAAWGKKGALNLTAEYLAGVDRYAKEQGRDAYEVDAITRCDLELDRLYRDLNTAQSSCGDCVIWERLTHPYEEAAPLAKAEALMVWAKENESARVRVQSALAAIGRAKDRTLWDDLEGLKKAEPIGTLPYACLAILTVADIIFLFIRPLPAVIGLIALTAVNIALSLRMREKTGGAVRGFKAVLGLIDAAETIEGLQEDSLREQTAAMAGARAELAAFKRGSSLVTGSGSGSGSLLQAILTYVNLLLHLDLLKFDQMLKAYAGHEEAARTLFKEIGQIEAAIAAASYKEALSVSCRPEFLDKQDVVLDVAGLVHPLLKEPVPVTVTLKGGMLVTGSNASGKSTFLKEMAISAILAQSFMIAPAESYRAPFLKVMTSMALTDNLTEGESYYIVEIRSIRRILEALKSGGPYLTVVDEVLKGTNTTERIAASARILEAMRQPNALVLAATHDRELTYMLKELYDNRHFEETVEGDDIVFTYEILDGPASTRNAIRLLEAENYDPAIVKGASETAAHFEATGEWTLGVQRGDDRG